jgi:hypothetical protein
MPTPTPATPPPSPEPEFNPQQNVVIGDLANAMAVVSLPLLIIGVLYFIGALQLAVQAFSAPRFWAPAIYVALAALFPFVLGLWTRRAAESFAKIPKTSGQDMTHLMGALGNLRNLYGLLRALIVAYALVVLIALVAGVIAHFTLGQGK